MPSMLDKMVKVRVQVSKSLRLHIPWYWKSPIGLHTDGYVVYHWTLPIAAMGKREIVGFKAFKFSKSTSALVNSVIIPIADRMVDAEEFKAVIESRVARVECLFNPARALLAADLLRETR